MTTMTATTHYARAETLAADYDQAMDIWCDWATGDAAAFQAFIDPLWTPEAEAAAQTLGLFPRTSPDQPAPRPYDAISDCGGGSEAVYWHDIPDGYVYGIATSEGVCRVKIDTPYPAVVDYVPVSDEEE